MPTDTVTPKCVWQTKPMEVRHGHDLWQRVYKMVAGGIPILKQNTFTSCTDDGDGPLSRAV